MSSEEKENWISLVSSLLVSTTYLFFIYIKFSNSTFTFEEELKFWASAILLIIPIKMISQIILFILFSIFRAIITGNSDEKEIYDERDKIIELKGERNISNFIVFGLITAFISVILGGGLTWMFVIIIASSTVGEVVGIISKIYYYNKGV